MCKQLSGIENKLEVIEELPREERGHGCSYNLTYFIRSKEQGNNKIAPNT